MATLTIVFQQYSKELHKTWVFNALVLCFAFLSSLFWLIKLRRSASKRNFPPSPPKLPLIGNLHQLGLLSPRSFLALSDKYGPLLLLHLGQSPTLLASSAEMAQEILKTQDADFANRHIPWPAGQLFYGGENIGFSSYGERWKELRKPCVTALLSWKSVQSSNYIRKEEIADLVMKLRELSFQKEPANLGKMLINIATNIIFRCVLGRKYEEDVGPEFAQVTMEVSDLSLAFSFRDFFPSIGWMDKFTGLDRKVGGTFRKFDQFLDRAIKEQEEMKDESEPSEKKNLIQILLDLWNGGTAGSYLTKKSFKAVIMFILSIRMALSCDID
ncbi:Cytochrome P450 [Dillenia turbinata]|uniref:Cytochrome P450 n=1 Tax=Dillenia turbinata TaxID=194707 RepID=A0AAN8Z8F0_9MAGN